MTFRAVLTADPLWFGAEVLRWLHVTDDADKADSNTLTKEEVKEVGKALVERIKARARAGEPLFNVDVPQEQSLLYEWWRVAFARPTVVVGGPAGRRVRLCSRTLLRPTP